MKRMSYPRFLARAAMTLLAVFCCLTGARAQETLTVYDGTDDNSHVPFYGLYADTQGAASECVIPSDQLEEMAGGEITAMTFYLKTPAAAAWTGTHQVYIGEVDATTLTGITGPDAFTVVKTASFDATGTELTVEFDEPYTYEGGNLLIGTYVSVAGNYKSAYFFGVNQTENTGWYRNNGTATGGAEKFIPKTTFEYTPGGVQTCAKPSTFVVSDITTTGATFEWEDTGAGSYSFEYKKASDTEWTTVSVEGVGRGDASIKTYTLSDLDPGTDYNARVKAICGTDSESGYKTLNFNTYLCTPEDMCAINISLNDSYGDGWNGGKLEVVDVETGRVLGSYTISSGNSADYTLNVCDGRAINIVYTQGSYPTENGWVVTDIFDEVISEHAGGSGTTAATTGVQATYTVNCTPPACPKPTGLAVNYEGGIEATISWTSDATAWNLSVNGTVTSVTENPYTLTNLELGTAYEVKVQAVCSETETSEWTNAVSFKTDNCMPEDMCSLTFEMADSYGDGWNGSSIQIYDYTDETVGELLATVTLSSGSEGTQTLNFCNGQELALIWSSGSYDSECSYTITDLNGDIVAQNDFELAMAYTIDCTVTDCRRPTDFAASEIGPHSAVLSWTENGEATAWVIEYISENDEESTTITVESNPYTLTGLAAETMYAAQVSPVCDDDAVKPSEVISWTTTVAAPAPTNLVANRVNANSATLNWEGVGNDYNVRYGQALEADPTAPATIILTAGDVWGDNSGYQMVLDADATAYETAYNNNTGWQISTWEDFEYLIPSTADYDVASTNVVFNNSIAIQIPAGTYDYFITNPSEGKMYIAGSNGNVPARYDNYVFEPGVTYEFTLARFGNYDGVNLTITPPVEWTTVEGVTSPYQLTDLDPSTEYYWQVQANCGEDGLSQWSSTSTFTTGSYSDAPTELAATATSSTATLEWTGSQDSYNVRYRVTSHGEVLAEQNFDDSSLGNWTTIDADGDGNGWVLGSAVGGVYLAEGGSLAGQGHNDSAELLTSGSYSNVVGELTPDNYLVSPQVALGGKISFYAQAQDASYAAEHFGVAVSTAGNTDAADFTTIAEWTMNADGTGSSKEAGSWGIFTVDLSDYAGQQGYVAIRHFNCTDQFLLNIDDIVIEGPAEAETEWTELTVSDNSVEIDGLESNTEYEWQVQGILDEGTTNWTIGDNFTTLPLIKLADAAEDNSTIIDENIDAVADVTLAGRTLFKDGNWNTLCLPFDVELEGSPLEGATAKTLNSATMTGNHVSLTFGEAVTKLEAGVPYIIKWETPGDKIVNPEFKNVTIVDVAEDDRVVSPIDGVKFIGYYDAFGITAADQNIYYMTADNTLKYTGVNRTLKACRAYFEFSEAATAGGVREFTLNFGDSEATGITSIDNEQLNNESGWYTVDGKKLDKQPKRKGVYINNGIKVVIK